MGSDSLGDTRNERLFGNICRANALKPGRRVRAPRENLQETNGGLESSDRCISILGRCGLCYYKTYSLGL